MFHPILPSSQIYEERPREHLNAWHAPRNLKSSPSRWDYFLLSLGDLLINTGKRVKNGSAYCSESDVKIMRINPSGGSA